MHGLSPHFHGLDLNLMACRLKKLKDVVTMHRLPPHFHGLDLNLIACRLRKLVLFTEETDTTICDP